MQAHNCGPKTSNNSARALLCSTSALSPHHHHTPAQPPHAWIIFKYTRGARGHIIRAQQREQHLLYYMSDAPPPHLPAPLAEKRVHTHTHSCVSNQLSRDDTIRIKAHYDGLDCISSSYTRLCGGFLCFMLYVCASLAVDHPQNADVRSCEWVGGWVRVSCASCVYRVCVSYRIKNSIQPEKSSACTIRCGYRMFTQCNARVRAFAGV